MSFIHEKLPLPHDKVEMRDGVLKIYNYQSNRWVTVNSASYVRLMGIRLANPELALEPPNPYNYPLQPPVKAARELRVREGDPPPIVNPLVIPPRVPLPIGRPRKVKKIVVAPAVEPAPEPVKRTGNKKMVTLLNAKKIDRMKMRKALKLAMLTTDDDTTEVETDAD